MDALGAEAVTGVSMPSRYSSEGSKDEAKTLAEHLGIRYLTMPIEETFAAMLETLREPFRDGAPAAVALAEENLQARIRGNLLMALSNAPARSCSPPATSRRWRSATRHSTATWRGASPSSRMSSRRCSTTWRAGAMSRRDSDLIPQNTLDKPPSAELRADQKDTDRCRPTRSGPDPQAYVEEDRGVAEIARMGCDAATVRRMMAMVDRSEYKRRQAPRA